jgi:uncharacterized protein (DUF1778 family)
MEPSKRNAPSTVRLTEKEREIIDLAATAEGRDRSQFMRYHAVQAARVALGIPAPSKAGAANGEAR